jgi:hypothetical protein
MGRSQETLKRLVLAALFVACGGLPSNAEDENDTTFYTEYIPKGFPAVRENPSETRSSISLKTCKSHATKNYFSEWIFEGDALRKFDRFGAAGLDADDRKWISSHDNRKAACLAFIKANGGTTYVEQAKAWLREWLR